MKVKSVQTNFARGTVSPKLFGRIDLSLYEKGVKTCHNFVVMPQGGVTRRPGTEYIATVKNNGEVRLIPFEGGIDHGYILELGHGTLRFYHKGLLVQNNNKPLVINTPYTQNDLWGINHAQSANVLYLVHPYYPPKKLTLNKTTGVWTLADVAFTNKPTEWNGKNYPSSLALFEGRSVWTTPNQSDTVWFSKRPDKDNAHTLHDMTLGAYDNDAMKYTLQGTQNNAIQWLYGGRKLHIGTTGNTRTMTGNGNYAISPSSVQAVQETANGCSPLNPVQASGVILYLGRSRKRIHAFVYDMASGGFISPDISAFADHVMASGVKDWTYAQDPYSIVWIVRDDGTLVGMSYDSNVDMIAFHTHRLGGHSDLGDYGVVESITTIPADSKLGGTQDEVWMVVRRIINKKTVRTVERMTPFHQSEKNAHYVDCGKRFSFDVPKTKINGFSHLKGELVDILGDGAIRPMVRVKNDGFLMLANDNGAKQGVVGLPYDSVLETLPHAVELANMDSYGDKVRSVTFTMRVQGMMVFSYGIGLPNGGSVSMTKKDFRTTKTSMDSPPPVVSGFVDVTLNTGFKKETSLRVQIDRPYGGTVLGIGLDMIVNS